jgi:hypothetical protein
MQADVAIAGCGEKIISIENKMRVPNHYSRKSNYYHWPIYRTSTVKTAKIVNVLQKRFRILVLSLPTFQHSLASYTEAK